MVKLALLQRGEWWVGGANNARGTGRGRCPALAILMLLAVEAGRGRVREA